MYAENLLVHQNGTLSRYFIDSAHTDLKVSFSNTLIQPKNLVLLIYSYEDASSGVVVFAMRLMSLLFVSFSGCYGHFTRSKKTWV